MVLCWSCWTYFKPSQSKSKDFPALQLLLHIHWVFLFSGRSSGEQVCSLQKPTQALDRVHKAGEGQLNIHVSIWSYKVKFNLTVKHSYLSPPLRGSPIPSEGNTLIKWPSALCMFIFCPVLGCPKKSSSADKMWVCFEGALQLVTKGSQTATSCTRLLVEKRKLGKGKLFVTEVWKIFTIKQQSCHFQTTKQHFRMQ